MKRVVVTGAAGFAGTNLTKELLQQGYFVYGVVRPGSTHNERLCSMDAIKLIELDLSELKNLTNYIHEPCDAFFHLAWVGERDDIYQQYENIAYVLQAVETAAKLGCKRFICTGSQAEYGNRTTLTTEDTLPNPVNAYGAAKVAALYLSKRRAKQLEVDWIWGRIFSLYGFYEPYGRMLPDLLKALETTGSFKMTNATQPWDYLFARDAAKALVLLMEKGHSGEIYNIASGEVHQLRWFTEYIREKFFPDALIEYANNVSSGAALCPSIEKIFRDTGWCATTSFGEGMNIYWQDLKSCV